ncbi:MAG: deoxyribodipyrimidine photo-lyase/cryptochrome family protein [Burkholderiales bacterium]|nr:MAG: deoxyribodipyrimidine photo-lyase/cryptochrome family protein [Burkholderiales bacterium]TAG82801.1 MAG: deoxyribodipyrimidine photo-lyase/cryptochrome family protein [Betaproteobacteria bacterium]
MDTAKPQVVWFKRDLRWVDHAPLCEAAKRGPVIALWVYEPEQWQQPDAAPQHLGFANECLRELDAWCVANGGKLIRMHGDIVVVLETLRSDVGAFELLSHEETGNGWSYERDKKVARWCRANEMSWHEFPSNAVVRCLDSRDRWTKHWNSRMTNAPLAAPTHIRWVNVAFRSTEELTASALGIPGDDKPRRLKGGRQRALGMLNSFLMERGQYYRFEMSSPTTAATSCSRLSPHLAWGSISIRECVAALIERRDALRAMELGARPDGFLASIKSFEARLHWHCHFIQKLEDEPEIEFRNVHRGFDGLRHEAESIDVLTPDELRRYRAWCEGRTGFPFVDACMRSLAATGWINFRMRAMLMSFASYNLWLHWRLTGLHLAREFIDFEPGIHWSQAQMQSGVTGINTVRIYNVVKQSIDQDPEGVFIRRWVPELAHLSGALIHTPWRADIDASIYRAPIVDQMASMREAKEKIYSLRKSQTVREESKRVYEKHGSRNPAREGTPKITKFEREAQSRERQGSLFD